MHREFFAALPCGIASAANDGPPSGGVGAVEGGAGQGAERGQRPPVGRRGGPAGSSARAGRDSLGVGGPPPHHPFLFALFTE